MEYKTENRIRAEDIALVLGDGGLAGAISAGFMAEICRNIGVEHFSTIYGYSVGVYPATYGIANQPDIIENTWRNHVNGIKLINPFNLFTFGLRPILKLEYLKKIFQNQVALLDVKKVFNSKTKTKYALIDYNSDKVYFQSPERTNIFKLMNAACALPIVHGPIRIKKKKYLDPSFVSGEFPGIKEIIEKHDKVVIVINFPKDYNLTWFRKLSERTIFRVAALFYPKNLQEIFNKRNKMEFENKKFIENNTKVLIYRPNKLPLKSAIDTNKKRINESFEIGIELAKNYCNYYVTKSNQD